MRKNSLSAQFSVERYIVLISKSFSSSSRSHHQVVFIIKSFSSSRSHQVVLIIKQCSSSSHTTVSSDRDKPTYQVNLSSHLIKPFYQVVASTQKQS
jgi:hypothetical protein